MRSLDKSSPIRHWCHHIDDVRAASLIPPYAERYLGGNGAAASSDFSPHSSKLANNRWRSLGASDPLDLLLARPLLAPAAAQRCRCPLSLTLPSRTSRCSSSSRAREDAALSTPCQPPFLTFLTCVSTFASSFSSIRGGKEALIGSDPTLLVLGLRLECPQPDCRICSTNQ